MLNNISQKTLKNSLFFAGGLVLLASSVFSSASFASEISDSGESREYVQSVSSSCSPQFSDITPEKYSDIGEIESLSFTLKNNVNPDSVSVKINNKNLDFSLYESEISGKFSGIIDVSQVENGRQIVSLYAQSNDSIHCSFRDEIYVLYKNSQNTKNIHLPENFINTSATGEVSRDESSETVKITFPSLDSTVFTISSNKDVIQGISGTAPKNTKKIWVYFSDEQGNTEHYFLRKFRSGDNTWKYFASEKYNNLSRGLNTYRVYAEFKNGKFSDAETIILFYPTENSTKPFVDTIGHWAENSITFLRSKGIVHGRVKNKLYAPDKPITKAESLKIATLSFNVKKHAFQQGDYIDVDASDWFADYSATAEKSGVIFTPRKNISPERTLSENEAVSIITAASFKKSEILSSSSEVTRAEFAHEVVKLMK